MRAVFGDWEIGTIVQASSGRPVTVFNGGIPGLTNGISGTGQTANQRPNLVAGQDCQSSGGSKEQFLNPDAWTLVGIPFGTFGNSPRGVCLGPGFFQTDLAFYKNGLPGTGLLPDGPGVLQEHQVRRAHEGTVPLRDLQRVQHDELRRRQREPEAERRHVRHGRRVDGDDDHGATNSGTFGQATGTRDPRQAQFGFKLMF